MKLLSWNIQAGIATTRFSQYATRAHRQFLQTPGKLNTLRGIADVIADYDVVCLQEVDLGGRRSGFSSQVEFLAAESNHPYFEAQENRVVRKISRHGNAIFSRYPLRIEDDMKLPGKFVGRGALIARVEHADSFVVVNTHLSLGAVDRAAQLSAIGEALPSNGKWVLCGDLNLRASDPALKVFYAEHEVAQMSNGPASYPSWTPKQDLDHILCGADLLRTDYLALPVLKSDHLPVTATIVARDHEV
jgi:endonuclease/exonuclease/phosphatase family metal-dependent hydrolase